MGLDMHFRLNGGRQTAKIGWFGRVGDNPLVFGFNQPCARSGYRQIMGNNIHDLGAFWPSGYANACHFILKGGY